MRPLGTFIVRVLPAPALIRLERSRSPSSTVMETLSVAALMPPAPTTSPLVSVTVNEPFVMLPTSVLTFVRRARSFFAVTVSTFADKVATEGSSTMLPVGAASVMLLIAARDSTTPLIVRLPESTERSIAPLAMLALRTSSDPGREITRSPTPVWSAIRTL